MSALDTGLTGYPIVSGVTGRRGLLGPLAFRGREGKPAGSNGYEEAAGAALLGLSTGRETGLGDGCAAIGLGRKIRQLLGSGIAARRAQARADVATGICSAVITIVKWSRELLRGACASTGNFGGTGQRVLPGWGRLAAAPRPKNRQPEHGKPGLTRLT